MIRVARPQATPARLASHGQPDMFAITAEFDSNHTLYSTGPRTLKFNEKIYGHRTVKSALQSAQHNKCCYCEGKFEGLAAGDVEHFRPKAFIQQSASSDRLFPGYYWLAYSWENLLFSCQTCNRSHKRNIFPLANPSRRARHRSDDVNRESPLLINPAGPDDPRDHIRFHMEVPAGTSRKGKLTIEVLKLDRPALNDLRREQLNIVKTLSDIVKVLGADTRPKIAATVRNAQDQLRGYQRPSATFSAMTNDFIAT